MNLVDLIRFEADALWRNGRGKIFLAIALPWGILVGTRMALPVLLPHIQSAYGISLSVAGLLVTILWLGTAIGQLPGGILADRYSESLIMAVRVGVVAIALTFVIFAPNTLALFVAVLLWGLGHSLYPIARITILSDIYPDRLGSALGLTMATGDIGQTVLPPIAGALAVLVAWQVGLGFVVLPLAVAAVAIWVLVPTSSQDSSAVETLSTKTARYILGELRRPTMVFMTFILFLYIFLWQAFTSFFPTYLVAEKQLSPTIASVLFGAFFAAGAVVKPLGGMAYDRIGMRWSLIVVLVGPVGGLLVLPLVDTLVPILLVTLLVSTMLGTGAITQSFLADQFAADMQGTGLGVVRTTAAVLGSAGPVLFGVVADRGFFDEGYVVLAAIMAVVVLLTFRMPEPS